MSDSNKILTTNDALNEVHSIPRNESGPVFNEPWEAEAFAMTLALHEKGVFTWAQWAEVLSDEITRAQVAGDPHWLAALERIVVEHNIASEQQISDLHANWNEAAMSTPHGQPIVLPNR